MLIRLFPPLHLHSLGRIYHPTQEQGCWNLPTGVHKLGGRNSFVEKKAWYSIRRGNCWNPWIRYWIKNDPVQPISSSYIKQSTILGCIHPMHPSKVGLGPWVAWTMHNGSHRFDHIWLVGMWNYLVVLQCWHAKAINDPAISCNVYGQSVNCTKKWASFSSCKSHLPCVLVCHLGATVTIFAPYTYTYAILCQCLLCTISLMYVAHDSTMYKAHDASTNSSFSEEITSWKNLYFNLLLHCRCETEIPLRFLN